MSKKRLKDMTLEELRGLEIELRTLRKFISSHSAKGQRRSNLNMNLQEIETVVEELNVRFRNLHEKEALERQKRKPLMRSVPPVGAIGMKLKSFADIPQAVTNRLRRRDRGAMQERAA